MAWQVMVRWMAAWARRGARHPLAATLRVALIGALAGWLAVALWGAVRGTVGVAGVEASLRPSWRGHTVIALPPFGALDARTHRAPLALTFRVEQIHLKRLLAWAADSPTRDDTLATLQRDGSRLLGRLAGRALGLAAAGALAGGLLLGLRRGQLAGVVLAGVAAVGVPLVLAAATIRMVGLDAVTYRGELARAPHLLQVLQRSRAGQALEQRLPLIIDRVADFYLHRERAMPADPARLTRVLHISDLHNNPLGLQFATELAREYAVDLVVVTGDITDYGHPLEAALLDGWQRFSVPVVMVSGNHDSQAVMAALAALPGVTVLDDGETATVAGLTVMGFGDPAAARASTGAVTATAADLAALTDRIRMRLQAGSPPDLLLVHQARVAEAVRGLAPVILTGHTHAPRISGRPESVVINPGTTGAAGVRYFTGPRPVRSGAAVLHLAATGAPRLRLVDLLALDERQGDYIVYRRNLAAHPAGTPLAADFLSGIAEE